MKTVRALRSINAGGQQRMTGEEFEVDNEVADYLAPMGQVALVRGGKVVRAAKKLIPEKR